MKDLEKRVQFLETTIKVLQTSVIETEVRLRKGERYGTGADNKYVITLNRKYECLHKRKSARDWHIPKRFYGSAN